LPPLVLGHLPGDEATRLERLVVGYALAGLPYLYVLLRWRDVSGLRALLGTALVARVALLTLPPLLSEDLWRYVWDGAVQWAGVHPYRYAPAAHALDGLAASPALAAVRAHVGHPEIPTVYPPVAQVLFALAGAAGPYPLVIRALAVLADGVTVWALWRWAERLGRDPRRAALYAFAPLPLLETAVGGHVDALGVAGLVAAGMALAGTRPARAGVGLAVAFGTKLFPALALPTVARRAPRAVLVALVALGLCLLPYVGGGLAPPGLATFAHRWRANDGAFALLLWPLDAWASGLHPPLGLPAWVEQGVRLLVGRGPEPVIDLWPDEVAFAIAKLVVLLAFGVVALRAWRRARSLDAFLGPVTAALLLLSPVVHPWYLLWLLPFLALAAPESRWPWPLIAWTLLTWIAYLPRPDYLRTGTWSEAVAGRLVEYVPVWFMLAVAAWRGLQQPGSPRSQRG
jgi:hypothetical protein